MSRYLLFVALILAVGVVLADDAPDDRARTTETQTQAQEGAERPAGDTESKAEKEEDAKVVSGMSVLGNREAPKSLVIVPWKSSEIGDSLGISPLLDDSRQPVDKEVFMRALSYYEIRSKRTP